MDDDERHALELRIADLEAELESLKSLTLKSDLLLSAMIGKLGNEAGISLDMGLPNEIPESEADKWAMSVILAYNNTAK